MAGHDILNMDNVLFYECTVPPAKDLLLQFFLLQAVLFLHRSLQHGAVDDQGLFLGGKRVEFRFHLIDAVNVARFRVAGGVDQALHLPDAQRGIQD